MFSESDISEIQNQLPGGYTVEADTGTWKGAARITRPNKTYFHALRMEDITALLHYGE